MTNRTTSIESQLAEGFDQNPYASYPFPQAHPDNLAVLATLSGLSPSDISQCRVLEIGCASGGHLIPMAASLPKSEFVGIDISQRQVASALELINALGLSNIKVLNCSISDLDQSLGTFDYVIAHGVYSWIPDTIKEQLLSVCRGSLNKNGVAYISYNTLPGWHFKSMLREMMLFHTTSETGSAKVAQSRLLLEFMAKSTSRQEPILKAVFEDQLKTFAKLKDDYALHDYLELVNDPVYFYTFVERAQRHGLNYITDAIVSTDDTSSISPDTFFMLRHLTRDPIRRLQYLDFLQNRTFRSSLLCDQSLRPHAELSEQNLQNLFVTLSSAKVIENAISRENDDRLKSKSRSLSSIIEVLKPIYPQSISFQELKQKCGIAGGDKTLSQEVLELFREGRLSLRTKQAAFVTSISNYPRVSPLAAYQAKSGHAITNQLHGSNNLSDLTRRLITILDGSLVRHDIQAALEVSLANRQSGTTLATDGAEESFNAQIEEALTLLRDHAYLVS